MVIETKICAGCGRETASPDCCDGTKQVVYKHRCGKLWDTEEDAKKCCPNGKKI